MEHSEDARTSQVTRTQHVLHERPAHPAALAEIVAPLLAREHDGTGISTLVVTPDAASAAALADELVRRGGAGLLPVTSARRATRLLGRGAARAIAGSPADLAALIAASTLKLDGVRALVIAGADELEESAEALQTVLAEVPREAATRVFVATSVTPAVEDLVERYARRARRVAPSPAQGAPAVQYLVTTPQARPTVLRRLLDELDPPSVAVLTHTEYSVAEVRSVLDALGHGDDDESARLVTDDAVEPNTSLVVLYDAPASADVLHGIAAAGAGRTVALVTARELAGLRALLPSASLAPLLFPTQTDVQRQRDELLREELRRMLTAGTPLRELVLLEPLLDDFDGAELAAAAIRLLDQERARAKAAARAVEPAAAPRAASPAASQGSSPFTRLYVSVGLRDDATPGDLVGAITGEAGIPSDRIGKINLRDSHTILELASGDVERVVEAINGISIRGRRVTARVDQGPMDPREGGPPRGGRDGARGGRDAAPRGGRPSFRGGDRDDRGGPPRGGRGGFAPRGDRSGPSRDRDPRSGPPRDRGDRSGPPRDRADRPARRPFEREDREGGRRPARGATSRGPAEGGSRGEWSSRAEALQRAKRGPRRRDEGAEGGR